jgi:mannose-6-phosphate isomerase-like protein (cupin superfamily)
MSEERKIDFKDLHWQSHSPGARFKAYQQAGKQVRLIEFGKDFIEFNWCVKGHIGLVVEGEIEIDFNGEVVKYHAGNGLFIPPGNPHKLKARTETATLFLVEEV